MEERLLQAERRCRLETVAPSATVVLCRSWELPVWGQDVVRRLFPTLLLRIVWGVLMVEWGKEKKQKVSRSEKKLTSIYRSIIISVDGLEDSPLLAVNFLRLILQGCNITPTKIPAGCFPEIWCGSSRDGWKYQSLRILEASLHRNNKVGRLTQTDGTLVRPPRKLWNHGVIVLCCPCSCSTNKPTAFKLKWTLPYVKKKLKIFFMIYLFECSICMYTLCQKRASHSTIDGCEPPRGCWNWTHDLWKNS